MMVFKKAIPRRTALRSIGVSLALPLLDSMVPAFSALAKTVAKPINRFGVVYVPNGMIMQQYLPATEGAGYELTPTLSALAPFREDVLVLSGLNCIPTPGRSGGAHAKASTRFLTHVSPPQSETWLDAEVSLDQILARELGKETQVASLELAIESTDTSGACDTGFACAYTNTLCWKSASNPLPMQNNPRVIFQRLFGNSSNPQERASQLKEQKSILDSVMQEISDLKSGLPGGDRTKLVEYVDSVRDVERRIQIAESQSDRELPEFKQPLGIPSDWEEHVKLMFDLQVLAYQCDLTRVVTFMVGREHSGMTFPQIGVPDAHHPISHHQQQPELMEKVAKINAYHVKVFTYLLEKLRATSDGDGTLLDHVSLIYGAGIADSNSHSPMNIPVILAGGGTGNFKGGRHIAFKDERLANLHLTLLDQFGVHRESLGDSTGRVDPGLLSLS